MLCNKCKEMLGGSHRYLVKIIENHKPDGKGEEAMKDKILAIIRNTPSSEDFYNLLERIEGLEEKAK